jgi:hypothetical protein
LTPHTRRALEELAGVHLSGGILGPFTIGRDALPPGQRGVYVVMDPEGVCAYVGKAFALRDSQRVQGRIREHVTDLQKRDAFAEVYLIPLKATTPPRRVEMVEGWVARHMCPYMGSAHPDPLRRSR